MRRIRISDDALNDLNRGFLFYEAQEIGLGDYFVSCLRADIESLKICAGIDCLRGGEFWRRASPPA